VSLFENEKSEDDAWLQKHKQHFRETSDDYEPSEGPEWKTQARKRRPAKKRPIQVGSKKQKCPHCGQPAAMELFRDTKCLACQVADYLEPLP
jgi:hypothetical protein